MQTVSLVVVNYNTPEHLPECLDALLALDYPAAEIVVVDNADSGGRAAELAPRHSAVRLIRSERNLGFGGGANLGFAQTSGELVGVLNPDVRVSPGWLRALMNGLERHAGDGAAIVGGKLLYPDGRVQHAGGLLILPLAAADHLGRGQVDGPAYGEDRRVVFVTGAAMLLRREAGARLGFFDPALSPVYYEDVDLCLRAYAAGCSVWYIADAVAEHAESSGTDRAGLSYFGNYHRNRLRFVLRHYPPTAVMSEFIPAEEARLRGDLPDADRDASLELFAGGLPAEDPWSGLAPQPGAVEGQPALARPAVETPLDRRRRLEALTAEALARWKVEERPFKSRVPGLAWLRERLNNLWTRWYVQPILAQQVEYNAALARAVRELSAQVAGLEAALLVRTTVGQALSQQQTERSGDTASAANSQQPTTSNP